MALTLTHVAFALAALAGIALMIVGWRGGVRRRRAAPNRIVFGFGMVTLTTIWLIQPWFASASSNALPEDVGLWTIDQLIAFEVDDDEYRVERDGVHFLQTPTMFEILRRVRDRLVDADDLPKLVEVWRAAAPNSRVRHQSIADGGRLAELGSLLLDDDRLLATDRERILAPLLESRVHIAGQGTPVRRRVGAPISIGVVADGPYRHGVGLVGGKVRSWVRTIAVIDVRNVDGERVPFRNGLHPTDRRSREWSPHPTAFNFLIPNRLTIELDRLPEGEHRFVAEIDEWIAPDDLRTRHHSPRGGDTPPAEVLSRRHRIEFGIDVAPRGTRSGESGGNP